MVQLRTHAAFRAGLVWAMGLLVAAYTGVLVRHGAGLSPLGINATWPTNGQEGVGKPHFARLDIPHSVPSPKRLGGRTVHGFPHLRARTSNRDSGYGATMHLRATREHDDYG